MHETVAVGSSYLALSPSITHCVHDTPTTKAAGYWLKSCGTMIEPIEACVRSSAAERPQLTQICDLAPRSIQAGSSVRSEQACITTSDKIPGGQSSILDFRG